jgi:hypothetical protein
VPAISDLHVAAPPSNQRSINLQLAAVDPAGDLGETPYIWFTADCGGEPIVGTIRGKASARDVRVSIPDLRVAGGSQGTPKNKCDLAVRLTDAAGVESNTLKTTVELKN